MNLVAVNVRRLIEAMDGATPNELHEAARELRRLAQTQEMKDQGAESLLRDLANHCCLWGYSEDRQP